MVAGVHGVADALAGGDLLEDLVPVVVHAGEELETGGPAEDGKTVADFVGEVSAVNIRIQGDHSEGLHRQVFFGEEFLEQDIHALGAGILDEFGIDMLGHRNLARRSIGFLLRDRLRRGEEERPAGGAGKRQKSDEFHGEIGKWVLFRCVEPLVGGVFFEPGRHAIGAARRAPRCTGPRRSGVFDGEDDAGRGASSRATRARTPRPWARR